DLDRDAPRGRPETGLPEQRRRVHSQWRVSWRRPPDPSAAGHRRLVWMAGAARQRRRRKPWILADAPRNASVSQTCPAAPAERLWGRRSVAARSYQLSTRIARSVRDPLTRMSQLARERLAITVGYWSSLILMIRSACGDTGRHARTRLHTRQFRALAPGATAIEWTVVSRW